MPGVPSVMIFAEGENMLNESIIRNCKAKIERDGERYLEAKRRWLSGESLSSIEKNMRYPRHALSMMLQSEGYEIKRCGQKYHYNDTYFETIDTEEKAYWLGFLYADGEIDSVGRYCLRLGLSIKDYYHVKRLRDILAPDIPIMTYDALNSQTQKYHRATRVSFCSKKLVLSLIKKGCTQAKEQTLSMPYEYIPEDLLRHFIRGFFDGDGCAFISKGKVMIDFLSASPQIIYDIQDKLVKDIKIAKNKICSRKRFDRSMTLYSFRNAKQKDIVNLYHYFYDDATIFLKRKEEILRKAF